MPTAPRIALLTAAVALPLGAALATWALPGEPAPTAPVEVRLRDNPVPVDPGSGTATSPAAATTAPMATTAPTTTGTTAGTTADAPPREPAPPVVVAPPPPVPPGDDDADDGADDGGESDVGDD